VRDQIDRLSKSVHTALCVLCFVSMIVHEIARMSHCLDRSTPIRGKERATIKAHPATPHLPRPYGKGIPPQGWRIALVPAWSAAKRFFDAGYEKAGKYEQDEENI